MHFLLGTGLFFLLAAICFFVPFAYIKSACRKRRRKPAVPLKQYGYAGLAVYLSLIAAGLAVCLGLRLTGVAGFAEAFFFGAAPVALIGTLIIAPAMLSPDTPAQRTVQNIARGWLAVTAVFSIAVTLMILLTVFLKSVKFFADVPVNDFLFGTDWNPQMMTSSTEAFGVIPLFTGTLLITAVALCFAGPVGLLSAVYLAECASAKTRARIKPALEVLSGIPTVVYGYIAATLTGPSLAELLRMLGGEFVSAESALSAGLVMGVMISPIIISLSDDALKAVPRHIKDASRGLGATEAETALKVTLPAAMPGIVSAFLLAVSRAVGETMIVVMAAGLIANLTVNPLEPVTTMTVQIVHMLTGDQEFGSAKTLSAYAIGLTLFVITWGLNYAALRMSRKFKTHL